MNIKSLLLGSAAAMVAVSGAQAADAVVVEPEPVEYVRVCDAYGSGFFFIPGTETCLRFNGYVRSYYSVSHYDFSDGTEVGYTDWASRARMQVTANSETDWGTLSGFFRIDTDVRGSSGAAQIDRAMLSLAGFRAGLGAQYWVTNHGFAGVNLAGIVSDPLFLTTEDGPYSGSTTQSTMFDYTWAGDGLSITAGVQNLSAGAPAAPVINRATNTGGNHDYYAGFNYSADWGGVAFTWMNDSNAVDNAANVGDGDAYKISVDLDLSEFIPGGILHGMYMDDSDDVTQYVVWGAYADAESIWQISYQMDLGDEFVLAAQYSNIDDNATNNSSWIAGVGLNWFPAAAPGFSVYASYSFGEVEGFQGGTAANGLLARNGTNVDLDAFSIRVRRNF